MPRKVGLFVGGVQKAGTTTLFGYLEAHPQLLPAHRKELHFFDDESRDWDNPDYARLEAAFDWTPDDDRTAFEVTPIYLFWPRVMDRLAAYNPDARLVFIFRDPIERAFSHWRMEVHRNAEDLDFATAIRSGRQRLAEHPETHDVWRIFSYVERGFYARQLERVYDHFPRDSVLIIKNEDLARAHGQVLDRIAAHVGIAPFPSLPARRDFVGAAGETSPAPADVDYLRDLFHDEMVRFAELSGLDIGDWLSMRM